MTTKFNKPVFRETEYATIRSKRERKIVCGFEPGDVMTLRLKGERKQIEIGISTIFRYASMLDAARTKRVKAAEKKARGGK